MSNPVTFYVATPDRLGEIVAGNTSKYITKLKTLLDSSQVIQEGVCVVAVTSDPQPLSALHRALVHHYARIYEDLQDNDDAFTYLANY